MSYIIANGTRANGTRANDHRANGNRTDVVAPKIGRGEI